MDCDKLLPLVFKNTNDWRVIRNINCTMDIVITCIYN